ncbi:MAG: hypothetical protein KAY37_15690, partial [Phycisphaerae bacterium]|nr:hypothetical protein [Phycisphaerae bacterium]
MDRGQRNQHRLNEGYHVVYHNDHGSNVMIGMASHCGDLDWLTIAEVKNNLSYGDKQSVIYSNSCSSNSFNYNDCIGEAFVNHDDGGALAYIGNTHKGSGAYIVKAELFFESLFDDDDRLSLGAAFSEAQRLIVSFPPPWGQSDAYSCKLLNMLGDPTMNVWKHEPQTMSVEHPTNLTVGDQSFAVTITTSGSTIPLAGAHACICMSDMILATETTDVNGTATLYLTCDETGTATLTVTAPDYLPYQAELTVNPSSELHLYVSQIEIDDTPGQPPTDGNGDGLLDAGETAGLTLSITNSGGATASECTAILASTENGVTIHSGTISVGDIATGTTVSAGPFVIDVDAAFPTEPEDDILAGFTLVLNGPEGPGGIPHYGADEFNIMVCKPRLIINNGTIIDDGTGNSNGDGDGVAEAGEIVAVYWELANVGLGGARGVYAVALEGTNISVLDSSSTFGNIETQNAIVAVDSILLELSLEYTETDYLGLEVYDAYGQLRYQDAEIYLTLPTDPPCLCGTFEPADIFYLYWDPVPGAAGYHVYRSANPSGPFERRTVLPQAGSSFFHDEHDPATTYYYVATSVSDSGIESPPSSQLITEPLGACCIPGNLCTDTLECACDGNWYNSLCLPSGCPGGACCHGDGSCTMELENECLDSFGIWQGQGTDCNPNPCPQAGACCHPDGTCEIKPNENQCTLFNYASSAEFV